jgi:hypothetical protein
MRPYTRSSLDHMLEEAGARIEDADPGPATDEAQGIYEALSHELHFDVQGPCGVHKGNTRVESVYSVERAISGTPLRDSFHLGSTIINDYGRPYQSGFNDYSGASGYASMGRFLIYAAASSRRALGRRLLHRTGPGARHNVDDTIYVLQQYLRGEVGRALLRASSREPAVHHSGGAHCRQDQWPHDGGLRSAHYLNHEISFGKQDDWLGPGLGAGMAYSNNAENIYSFRINRIEPLRIPWALLHHRPIPLRIPGRIVEGPRLSQRSLGARREGQLPADGEPGIRLRAHRHLGRQKPRAHQPAHLPAQLLQLHRAQWGSSKTAPPIPARALAHSIFLPAPLAAEVADVLHRLRGARRNLAGRRSAAVELQARPLSLPFSRRSQARSARRSGQHRSLHAPTARAAVSSIGRAFSGRATPTRASCSATGSGAKTKAARPGSPIT